MRTTQGRPFFGSTLAAGVIGFFFFLLAVEAASGQSITIQGGNVTLSITTGLAGSEPLPVMNTATRLRYRRTLYTQKITVQTSCPGQNFGLTVVASNVTAGTAAPQVTLSNGMPPVDFITNIPFGFFSNATATLNYTATATFSQGNSAELGDDLHTVTYTISAQ
ncbi:MAG: hypothetical protein HBSIN02_11230 [Bacteroidia bacterium]|nr:MAG: hypothetical protein HBSIN02_11230 [Bacteroidia bacterium]